MAPSMYLRESFKDIVVISDAIQEASATQPPMFSDYNLDELYPDEQPTIKTYYLPAAGAGSGQTSKKPTTVEARYVYPADISAESLPPEYRDLQMYVACPSTACRFP